MSKIELLKQYVAGVDDIAVAFESGLDAKADALQSRIQSAIDRTHAKNAAAIEEFRAKYTGIDQQAIELEQEIQSANRLTPKVAQLAQLRASAANPIDPVKKLWDLQTRHPIHQWQKRIELIQAVMLGYLRQIGLQVLVPSEWQRIAVQVMQIKESRQLIQLFQNHWHEWQRIHWAIQDQSVFNELSFYLWKEKGCPTRMTWQRRRSLSRRLPPIVRAYPHLDPEYNQDDLFLD